MVNFASKASEEKPVLLSFSKKIRKSSFPYSKSRIARISNSPLDIYHSYQNLAFCPRSIQQLMTSKEEQPLDQVNSLVRNLKTPEGKSFDKHLNRLKTLTKNQENLVQTWLLENYKQAAQPNVDYLKTYYDFIKVKLEIERIGNNNHHKKNENNNGCWQKLLECEEKQTT